MSKQYIKRFGVHNQILGTLYTFHISTEIPKFSLTSAEKICKISRE